MIRLRDKDLEKLSLLLSVSEHDLKKLSSLNLLSDANILDMLILRDYRHLRKSDKTYTPKQMIQAIMDEYGVSHSKVTSAIYHKKKTLHFCSGCGKRISAVMSKKNDGLCDKCVSKTIKL